MHIPLGRCALAGWVVPHINASLLGGLSCRGTTDDCVHLLGRVDKVSDPEADGYEIDEAEIAFGGFVISGRQAA